MKARQHWFSKKNYFLRLDCRQVLICFLIQHLKSNKIRLQFLLILEITRKNPNMCLLRDKLRAYFCSHRNSKICVNSFSFYIDQETKHEFEYKNITQLLLPDPKTQVRNRGMHVCQVEAMSSFSPSIMRTKKYWKVI